MLVLCPVSLHKIPQSPGTALPDLRFLRAAQQGDAEAFAALMTAHAARVMRLLMAMFSCDHATAEDLTQEVFLRVHQALPQFDGGVPFAVWLHKIARNVAISSYRARRAQKRAGCTHSLFDPIPGTDQLPELPGRETADPQRQTQASEFLGRVRECMAKLPDEFREPVVLRDLQELSYDEISLALDLAPGTVRSRIHRGRLLLQHLLREFAP